ncbi:MAG: tetratricopeptide repeat protein, partial [Anaerolineales bacterium]|nr:tetratricopeptide repeat protein [Anaerolineales bacterium]
LPELRDRYPDLPQPTQEENSARQHLFEAITRLVQALSARKPIILFIDDWQWADAASLDVLHYAAVRWAEEKTPLFLLLTLRQEAISTLHPLQKNWLTHLNRNVHTSQLTLRELSSSETQHLVQGLFGSATANQPSLTHFNKWLFAETEGQPLFLTETLKALVAEGLVKLNETATAWRIDEAALNAQTVSGRIWHGIHEIIEGWLVQISNSAHEVLTAVSVLGQEASFDHICRVTSLEELQAIEALDELLGKQLLLEADMPMLGMATGYTFAHQKVSEFIYARAGSARRRLFHRRAFVSLQTQKAQAAACAYQAQKGELFSETIRYSLIAGNEALAIFAVQVARTHYETAWQVVQQSKWPEAISGADRQALYNGLGRAYELTEAWTRAKETYEAMIADAQNMGVETMECQGLNRLANVYNLGLFNPEQAVTFLEQAHKLAEKNSDLRRLAETERNLSRTASFMSNPDKALKHAEQATILARELDHPQLLADCLYGLAFVHVPRGQWEKVEIYATEARKLFTETGNLILAADCQRMIGGCQLHTGRPQESLVTLEETFLFSQQVENYWGKAEAARFLTRVHIELGNYGQAIALGKEGVRQARKVSHPIVIFAQFSLGQAYRTILALDLALPTLLEVTTKSAEFGFDPFPDQALSELCTIYALIQEWEQAYVYARKIWQIHAGSNWLPVGFTSWYETEALLRGGDGDLARAEVARIDGLVGTNRRYRLPLLRSQAVLAQWDGDVAQAVTHLEAALALAREIELPGEAWPILGELGKLYAEQGEDVKVREAYGEARAII